MTTIPPEATAAAGLAAAQMAGDWYCPRHPDLPRRECPWCVAEVALTAALPHIEAAIREQVAQEIEAVEAKMRTGRIEGSEGRIAGLAHATYIARGADR